MCYSALVWADYRRYIRDFGAEVDIKEFFDIFWRRKGDAKVKIPKAMEAAFAEPRSDLEREIKSLSTNLLPSTDSSFSRRSSSSARGWPMSNARC